MSIRSSAVGIAEILERILDFANSATLKSCMTVDRNWFQTSGRLIWCRLDSLKPLIELLSPLQNKTIDKPVISTSHSRAYGRRTQVTYLTVTTLAFESTDSIRWHRFKLYASFVKHLNIVANKHEYDSTVVSFIALWHPNPLLPSLQTLKVDCRAASGKADYALEFASLFVGEELKKLSVITDGASTPAVSLFGFDGLNALKVFLDAVKSRSPNVETFELSYIDSSGSCKAGEASALSTVAPAVSHLLRSLLGLRVIRICPKLASTPLLAALPGVECIHLQCRQHDFTHPLVQEKEGEVLDIKNALERAPPDTLRQLENLLTLALNIDYMSAILLLLSNTPTHLRQLEITSSKCESTIVSDLAAVIGKNCQDLHTLRLRSMDSVLSPSSPSLAESLQGLHQLRFFSLNQDICIPDYELKNLLRAWPLLEELQFDHRSGHLANAATFTPDILLFIASHLPLLRKLTLRISWNEISEPDLDTEGRLSRLEHFDSGPLNATLSDDKVAMIALLLTSLSVPLTVFPSGSSSWREIKKSLTLSRYYIRRARELAHRIKLLEADEVKWSRRPEACPCQHPLPSDPDSDTEDTDIAS